MRRWMPWKCGPCVALCPWRSLTDVTRSSAFYQQLGFEVRNTVEQDGKKQWAWLKCGEANLMLALSSRPMNADAQDVLFYLYAVAVVGYRQQLAAKGVEVGEMCYPFTRRGVDFA